MDLTGNQTRKSYSFKSVGTTKRKAETVTPVRQKPPIGIKTPIRLSPENGLFEMHTDLTKQVSDNLRNLLLTNHGERLGFYSFGANLGELVFDLGQEQADAEAQVRIKSAVEKFMPYVSLQEFQVFIDRFDNKEVAKIGIKVTYLVPKLDSALRSLEVMLYVGG